MLHSSALVLSRHLCLRPPPYSTSVSAMSEFVFSICPHRLDRFFSFIYFLSGHHFAFGHLICWVVMIHWTNLFSVGAVWLFFLWMDTIFFLFFCFLYRLKHWFSESGYKNVPEICCTKTSGLIIASRIKMQPFYSKPTELVSIWDNPNRKLAATQVWQVWKAGRTKAQDSNWNLFSSSSRHYRNIFQPPVSCYF